MRWTQKSIPEKTKINSLQDVLNLDEVLATILAQRGVENLEEAKHFFRPSLEDLHNPFLMKNMDKAVNRIEKAIKNKENILVFGDYDVDGTTAVSLVSAYLKSYYSNVATYIPDRYEEGYGISFLGIDFAQDNDFSLIIALDCGIKSIEHVEYATKKGIDFIICDHHLPGNTIPNAIAVLDPKQKDCNYPYKELCGCGIGFKLIQALAKNRNQTTKDLVSYLDLVATAIAADIVPITGENRILAKFGLEIINAFPRPGIKALIQNIKKHTLTITDVVFIIAPRINAAGRIKHGNYAVALLSEYNLEQAQQFAAEIEQFNIDRKELDKQTTAQALQQIIDNNEEKNYTTVVYQENWHKGIIGIVASRLIEKYYRPTLVFTKSGNKLAASARSVKHFDVYNALEQCSEFIEQFGGHMYAAGLTLEEKKYPLFKKAFEKIVSETINKDWLIPEITIDCDLNLNEINDKFIRILKQFEPFGPENMTPIFIARKVFDTGFGQTIGNNNEHLKLFVRQKNTNGFSAIGFGLGSKLELIKNQKPCTILFSIEENQWNGKTTVQLQIRDLKAEE
ncbi:MAG: single-stranded-DNA-specific exonuclease RecJ [Ottowia sp.]